MPLPNGGSSQGPTTVASPHCRTRARAPVGPGVVPAPTLKDLQAPALAAPYLEFMGDTISQKQMTGRMVSLLG